MASSKGAITITDVNDGLNPLSVVLSNQSHSFSADNNGLVAVVDRDAFSCEIYAFVGSSRIAYNTDGVTNNTYSLTLQTDGGAPAGSIVSAGGSSTDNGWTALLTDNGLTGNNKQAQITVTNINTNSTNSAILKLQIKIVNSIGNSTTIEAIISLTKGIEGAGGSTVSLLPSRQTFAFSGDGTIQTGIPSADIIINIATTGTTGALSAFYSIDGSNSWDPISSTPADLPLTPSPGSTNQIKALNLINNGSLTISSNNFSTNNIVSIKVVGSVGGSDIISIIKIADGANGLDSIAVFISSDNGGFAFHNNGGSTKILTAKVYETNGAAEITTGLTYDWIKDGISTGITTKTISLNATNIVNGGSNLYECKVTHVA